MSANSPRSAAPTKAPPPLNVPSLLALIMPFLCLFPVGIVLGVVGLAQTRDGVMRGRLLAIIGLVFSLLQLGFVGLAVVVGDDGVTAENAHAKANALEAEVDADIAADTAADIAADTAAGR